MQERSIENTRRSPGISKSLVSVIITTHNRSGLLGRAINSALAQDYRNTEIIIVDDASDDSTKEVVDSLAGDLRLKYIRHEQCRGGSAARNTGISNASGEYIAFLDDDDEWLQSKIGLQVEVFLNGDSQLGLVHCGIIRPNKDDVTNKYMPKYRGDVFLRQLLEDRVFSTSSWVVRRSCFFDNRVGMFDENLPGRQDYDMALRISRYYEVDYVPQHLAIVHEDSSNRITSNYEKRTIGHLYVLEKIRNYIEDFNAVKKRKIISFHYYSMARYLQIYGHFEGGSDFLIRSLREWPFNIKALVVYFFILFGDRELSHFENMRSLVRRALVSFQRKS